MQTERDCFSASQDETKLQVLCNWHGSVTQTESTLHQLSPYIGKIKSSIAASLISQFTNEGNLVYDPFSGSGTIALEAWIRKRRVIANDLSPYANLLTRAKLFPYESLDKALLDIARIDQAVGESKGSVDLRGVPVWVRRFFHSETLREIIAWMSILRRNRKWFLQSCLLGILHHQRPGFLSFPSSHTIPYLRQRKFPRWKFPELYEYRTVRDRLEAKVRRAFQRMPSLDYAINRRCYCRNAHKLLPSEMVDAIITSPPYMRLLDYGRDNRLRLWFLGQSNWHSLDRLISPGEDLFLQIMTQCFTRWKSVIKPQKYCILVMGDAFKRKKRRKLADLVSNIATSEVGGYTRVCQYTESIPTERRVRRGSTGSLSETILVLRNDSICEN